MIPTRLTIGAASLVLVSALSANADPAYVASTVNLRAGAGTGNEIVAKIPGGSLVEATNCSDWCEVEWQGKKGFAIATALDRSGRVRAPRTAARPAPGKPHLLLLPAPMSRMTSTCRSRRRRSTQRPARTTTAMGMATATAPIMAGADATTIGAATDIADAGDAIPFGRIFRLCAQTP